MFPIPVAAYAAWTIPVGVGWWRERSSSWQDVLQLTSCSVRAQTTTIVENGILKALNDVVDLIIGHGAFRSWSGNTRWVLR